MICASVKRLFRICLLLRKIEQTLHQNEGSFGGQVRLNVFAVKGVAPEVALSQVFLGCVPFILVEVGIVALLLTFPEISLCLLDSY